jgi:hypothetical protein
MPKTVRIIRKTKFRHTILILIFEKIEKIRLVFIEIRAAIFFEKN